MDNLTNSNSYKKSKEIFDELKKTTPNKQKLLTYLRNIPSGFPLIGDYFSSFMNDVDHQAQQVILTNILTLESDKNEELQNLAINVEQILEQNENILNQMKELKSEIESKSIKIVKMEKERYNRKFEYDVALSCAGEDRDIPEKIAEALKSKNVKVFYDKFYEVDMWGKELTKHFKKVYGPKARFFMPFISKYYPIKDWTDFEFSVAKKEAEKRKHEFILPVRLDDTKIVGLHGDIKYLDFNEKGIDGIVNAFLEKLELTKKIEDAVKLYKIEDEKKVHEAMMHVGHYGLEVMMCHGEKKNFAIPPTFKKGAYEKIYGEGSFERHIKGVTNLCNQKLVGLNTDPSRNSGALSIEYSYWWTSLGNEVLHLLEIIEKKEEVVERNKNLPPFFE